MAAVKSKTVNPKKSASKLLKDLPDDCSYEDIQYHLYVLQKVERGFDDSDKGKTFTPQQMKSKLKRWIGK